MNRRFFLSSIPAGALTLNSISLGNIMIDRKKFPSKVKKLIEKVMLAMLTMQRATWEQGVAMQALLELGEEEFVILMAKDAVLRQSEDGRLAMLLMRRFKKMKTSARI